MQEVVEALKHPQDAHHDEQLGVEDLGRKRMTEEWRRITICSLVSSVTRDGWTTLSLLVGSVE